MQQNLALNKTGAVAETEVEAKFKLDVASQHPDKNNDYLRCP